MTQKYSSHYSKLVMRLDDSGTIMNLALNSHTTSIWSHLHKMYMKSFIAKRVKRHFWHFYSKGTIHGRWNVRTTQWFGRAEHCSHTMGAPPPPHNSIVNLNVPPPMAPLYNTKQYLSNDTFLIIDKGIFLKLWSKVFTNFLIISFIFQQLKSQIS